MTGSDRGRVANCIGRCAAAFPFEALPFPLSILFGTPVLALWVLLLPECILIFFLFVKRLVCEWSLCPPVDND
jgi:hypothetical protein